MTFQFTGTAREPEINWTFVANLNSHKNVQNSLSTKIDVRKVKWFHSIGKLLPKTNLQVGIDFFSHFFLLSKFVPKYIFPTFWSRLCLFLHLDFFSQLRAWIRHQALFFRFGEKGRVLSIGKTFPKLGNKLHSKWNIDNVLEYQYLSFELIPICLFNGIHTQ